MEQTKPTSFFVFHRWLLIVLLVALFAGALGVRLINFTSAPLDFHSDRQEQSMLKARGMYYATLTDVPAWQKAMAIAEWEGQPIQEPEIMEHLAAFSYSVVGAVKLWIPRLYSILFWLIGGLALFSLMQDMIGSEGAIVGIIFYLFAYFGVMASRSFQPDPLMVASTIVGLWALFRWYRKPTWIWTVIAGLLCGWAIYVKVPAGFFIAGGIAGLVFGAQSYKKTFCDAKIWLLGVLALLPAIIYHVLGTFILHFLGNAYYDLRIYPSLLIDPYYYMSWIGKIDQVVGLPLFLAALLGTFLIRDRKARALLLGLWGSYFIYGLVFIYYSASHDYYTLPLFPLVAIGLAALAQVVIEQLYAQWKRPWIYAIALLIVLVWAGSQTYNARQTLKTENYSAQIALDQKIGDEIRNYNAVGLVADYTCELQYYGWDMLSYWPDTGDFIKASLSGQNQDLETLFKSLTAGKDLFVVTETNELDRQEGLKQILYNDYAIFDKGDGYVIFDLRKPKG